MLNKYETAAADRQTQKERDTKKERER